MNTLEDKTDGVYKVLTQHGTHYIIDLDNGRGKRVPAEGRNDMRADNDWFELNSIERCTTGQTMYILCNGIAADDWYTWRQSTVVTSIQALESEM